MSPSETEVRATLRELRRTARCFEQAAVGRSEEELRRRPDADGWSLHEVLAHLRGAADVQGGWIARMLEEDTPTIRYASPRTGMRTRVDADEDVRLSIRGFKRQRNELVKTLAGLALTDWTRGATFTGTKPGWTQSVYAVARGLVTHEHAHVEQITAAAGGSQPQA